MVQRKWPQRILLVLGAVLLVVAAASLSLYLYVTVRYPPERLGRAVAEFLAARLQRPVAIGRASFHVFRGFTLDSLRVGRTDTLGTASTLDSLFVRQITLRYDPKALLHRRLEIRSVTIAAPEVFLRSSIPSRQAVLDTLQSASAKRTEAGFPVSLHLSSFVVQGATLHWRSGAADAPSLSSTGWILRAEGARLARAAPLSLAQLRRLEIRCERGLNVVRWPVRQGEDSLSAPLNFELIAELDSSRTGKFDLRAAVPDMAFRGSTIGSQGSTPAVPQPLELSLAGKFSLGDSVWLHSDELEARFLGSTPIRGEVHYSAGPSGAFRLRAGGGRMALSQLASLARTVHPELLRHVVLGDLQQSNLKITLVDIRRSGRLDSLDFTAQCELESPRLSLLDPPLRVDTVSLALEARLLRSDASLREVEASITGIAQACSLRAGGKRYRLHQITLDAAAALDSTFWPTAAHLHFEIQRAFGALAYVQSEWRTPGERGILKGIAKAEIEHLRLSDLLELPASGKFDFVATAIVPGDGTIRLQSRWAVDSLLVPRPLEPVLLAPKEGRFEGRGRFDARSGRIKLHNWKLVIADGLESQGSASIAPGYFLLQLDTSRIALEPLYGWLKPLLSQTAQAVDLDGALGLHLRAEARNRIPKITGRLNLEDGLFARRDAGFAAGRIQLRGQVRGDLRHLAFRGTGVADSIWIKNLGHRPIRHTHLRTDVVFDPPRRLVLLDSLWAVNDPLSLVIRADGRVDFSLRDSLLADIAYAFRASPDTFSPLGDRLALRGPVAGDGDIRLKGKRMRLSGEVALNNTSLLLTGGLQLDTLRGTVHYDYLLDRSGAEPVFLASDPTTELHLASAEDFRWELLYRPRYDTISIAALRLGDFRLENLSAFVLAREGVVLVPFFQVSAYDGSIGGRLLYDLRNATTRTAYLEAEVQAGRLSSAVLVGKRTDRTSLLSASIFVKGRGMRPEDVAGYQGWVDFTRIGRDVADDILRSLDPRATNRGIQNTRKLLSFGFRPVKMRFDLHDGYLYPKIVLKQPWYSPIRLSGGRIEMGRIPLRMFLRRARALRGR